MLRKEDLRFMTGKGSYIDDIIQPNTLWMGLVRSPYAHARILGMDTSQALALDGIVSCVTGEEMGKVMPPLPVYRPQNMRSLVRYALAIGKVRYVGEPVAAVIATSREVAEDAVELVKVEYERLPVKMALEEAAKKGSPLVYDEWGDNLANSETISRGDVDAAFAKADKIISEKIFMNRMSASPIETRGVLAFYDHKLQTLTVWMPNQHPTWTKGYLAGVLRIPESNVRLICPDIGGAFGSKGGLTQPELILTCLLSMRLKKPVKWIESRRAHFTGATLGRGQLHAIELAMTKEGEILGLKDKFLYDAGVIGFLTMRGPPINAQIIPNGYRIKNYQISYDCIATHKPADGPVRGYAQIESTFVMERIIDIAAKELNLDPSVVRLKNLVSEEEMPYDTGNGRVYDGGRYGKCLKNVLALANYPDFKQEQEVARKEGRYLGLGMAFHCNSSAQGPSKKLGRAVYEYASVRLDSKGRATVITGASPQGQGQETTLAQICASELPLDPRDIRVLYGDTSIVPVAIGTFASRTAALAGSAVLIAARKIKEKMKIVASHLLEVPKESLIFKPEGIFTQDGRSLSMKEIALASYEKLNLPLGVEPGLEASAIFDPPDYTFHYGAHVAKVEVNLTSGSVKILHYYAVSDSGNMINPLIVKGQLVGGTINGIGNALLEEMVYSEDGQLLSSTFMDYLLPLSTDAPNIIVEHMETPTAMNPLGARGAGEGGIYGAVPAIINAIDDALSPFNVRALEAPVTPERLWKLIRKGY